LTWRRRIVLPCDVATSGTVGTEKFDVYNAAPVTIRTSARYPVKSVPVFPPPMKIDRPDVYEPTIGGVLAISVPLM
jgi:hypothetical protein